MDREQMERERLERERINRERIDQLHTSLNSVKVLRLNVGLVFETLGNGLRADHGEVNKGTKFLLELQDLLNTVNANLRDVESAITKLNPLPPPSNISDLNSAFNYQLGNTAYANQEYSLDRQALYGPLVLSHKWTDKVREYSVRAYSLFQQNSLKRSYYTSNNKRRRIASSCHNVPPQTVDSVINAIERRFNDMKINISRPFTINAILQITLGRVLKAVVVCKGLVIEWVLVRGYTETLDLWTESRYRVFRKVTESSLAAMLHFSSPTFPELAINSFMVWLHSYNSLFSDPCKKCGNYLYNTLPPTWRDLRGLEPFHEECKP